MKKNDLILIGGILICAFLILIATRLWQRNNTSDAARVTVTIDGKLYGSYPLNEDYQEKITLPDGSYNMLQIKEGKATVTEASCPDKICVNHRAIHYSEETIVCLPNKVVVRIEGGDDSGVDAITN